MSNTNNISKFPGATDLDNALAADRRKNERQIATFRTCCVVLDGEARPAILRNMSDGGAMFEALVPASPGTHITYWWDGIEPVEARVAWVDGNRIGVANLSGPTEAVFSVEAKSPNRIMLNVDRVMRTDYVISDLQPTSFVIESFEDLFHKTEERDFERLYQRLPMHFTYATTAVIDTDDVLQMGTQEYALRGGRGSDARPV